MAKRIVRFIAQLISFITYPLFVFPLLVILYLIRFESSEDLRKLSAYIFLLAGLLPILFILIFLKAVKKISDWNLRIRKERYSVILFSLLMLVSLVFIFWSMELDTALRLTLVFLAGIILFFVVTLFWKISAHTAGVTLIYLLVLNNFGTWKYFGVVGIILVAWSRVYLNNHTILEVMLGIGLSLTIYFFSHLFILT